MTKEEKQSIKEYNELSLEEKVTRLEVIACRYAGWLDCENYEIAPMLDATKYWEEMKRNNNG